MTKQDNQQADNDLRRMLDNIRVSLGDDLNAGAALRYGTNYTLSADAAKEAKRLSYAAFYSNSEVSDAEVLEVALVRRQNFAGNRMDGEALAVLDKTDEIISRHPGLREQMDEFGAKLAAENAAAAA